MPSKTFKSGSLTIKVKLNADNKSYKALIYDDNNKRLAAVSHICAPVYQSRLFAADSAIIMAGVARSSLTFAGADPSCEAAEELLTLAEEAQGQFTVYYKNQKMVDI